MSGSALKRLSRAIKYTATWAADVLTVTTLSVHNLKNGDIVRLALTEVTNEVYNKVVTVTGTSTFTIPLVGYPFKTSSGSVIIDYFSACMTGEQPIFSLSSSSANTTGVIQFTTLGAAGAVVVLSVSNDQLGWVPVATVTVASADLATEFVTIANNWCYGKISITSIGAATNLIVTTAV